jgi:hypothetical protein
VVATTYDIINEDRRMTRMVRVIANGASGADAGIERMLGHERDKVLGYEARESVRRWSLRTNTATNTATVKADRSGIVSGNAEIVIRGRVTWDSLSF